MSKEHSQAGCQRVYSAGVGDSQPTIAKLRAAADSVSEMADMLGAALVDGAVLPVSVATQAVLRLGDMVAELSDLEALVSRTVKIKPLPFRPTTTPPLPTKTRQTRS